MDGLVFKPLQRENLLEKQQRKHWDILFEQIERGNVIPVIGPDFVLVNKKTSMQFLIDVISQYCQIGERQFSSYSQLVNDSRYQSSDINKYSDIYSSLTDLISDNLKYFSHEEENILLYRFLQIPYFTFVITTTFDTVVENLMKKIHGNRLRVMCFRNDASRNDDLINGEDMRRPTLMFGGANGQSGMYAGGKLLSLAEVLQQGCHKGSKNILDNLYETVI